MRRWWRRDDPTPVYSDRVRVEACADGSYVVRFDDEVALQVYATTALAAWSLKRIADLCGAIVETMVLDHLGREPRS